MSDFATYDDIMADLANDRDDSLDPEFRDPDGYCPHGNYVGGCGPDLMCQWCEDGISPAEMRRIYAAQRVAVTRDRAHRAELMLAALLACGMSGTDAAELAQDSSYVPNPRGRYG